jgi:peptidoglycan/xylan/chitin deacetylase (PgdA/CDA1 family)
VGESGTVARLTLVGVAAMALVTSSATWGRPAPPIVPADVPADAHAVPADARAGALPPAAGDRRPGPGRPAVANATTSTALPAPPPARPVAPAPGRSTPVFSRLPIAERVVFLGIDDGNVRDPAVIDHLQQLRVPFTVFLTMGPAQEDPAFWRRAVAAGGTIESHTLTHADLTTVSGAALRREVCGTLEPYTALSGRRPTLFRPPYGKLNEAVRRQAAECGYRAVILWTGSTNNGRLTMQEGPLHAGDILLLHWRDTLAADLDDVVARCRQEGFTIGRLQDYLP